MTRTDDRRRIRLAHVYYHLDVGGIENLLVDLLPRLDPELFDVRMICTRRPGVLAPRMREAGIPLEVRRCRSKLPIGLAMRPLARAFSAHRLDIVHTHAEAPSQQGTLAARRSGVPLLLVHFHGVDVFRKAAQVRREQKQVALRDVTLHVSRSVHEYYLAHVQPAVDNGRVIYNGVDTTLYGAAPDRERLARLAASLGIEGRGPILLKVARFHQLKGHVRLIEAFAGIRRRHTDAVLLLAGDGRRRETIEQAVRQHGLGESVRFLGLRHDTPDLYRLADLHLIASDREGFSVVLLEAMAAGTPQVVTDVGGNREAFGDSAAGLLVPPGDPDALAEAALSILEDPSRARAMRDAAIERSRVFAIEEQVRQIELIYLELARTRKIAIPDLDAQIARRREAAPAVSATR